MDIKHIEKPTPICIPQIWEGMCYTFAGMARPGKENGRLWQPHKVYPKISKMKIT